MRFPARLNTFDGSICQHIIVSILSGVGVNLQHQHLVRVKSIRVQILNLGVGHSVHAPHTELCEARAWVIARASTIAPCCQPRVVPHSGGRDTEAIAPAVEQP